MEQTHGKFHRGNIDLSGFEIDVMVGWSRWTRENFNMAVRLSTLILSHHLTLVP